LSTGGVSSVIYLVPGSGSYLEIDDISIVRAFDISTHYNLSKSYQYAIAATAPLTAADTAYIDANPEAMYRVLYDSLVLPSGFSSTDITHFYDGTGGVKDSALNKKCVQDIATPLGANAIVNGTFDTDLSNWTNVHGKATWESGTARMNNGIDTGISQLAQLRTELRGKYIHVSVDIIEESTIGGSLRVYDGSAERAIGSVAAIGQYSGVQLFDYSKTYIYIEAVSGWNGRVDNLEVREASVSEIANYTSNVRTNFLNTTYGATNLKLVKDASGRTTGVQTNPLLEFNGDGRYCDTGWTPDLSKDWTVEFVLDCTDTPLTDQWIGCGANGPFSFNYRADRVILFYGVDHRKYVIGPSGFAHIVGIYDGSTGLVSLYINNVETLLETIPTTGAQGVFKIDIDGTLINNVGLLKASNKKYTTAEVASAYTAAKVIYPTLP